MARHSAELHGWIPGVLGAGETGAKAYSRAVLEVLELGDEAVVELADFTLEGRAMRSVRQAVNRVARAGHTMEVDRQRDLTSEQITELRLATTRCATARWSAASRWHLGASARPATPS